MFQPFFQNRPLSSIDGMAAENPLIMALDAQSIAPGVTYHSIIANIHPGVPPEKTSDGLVSYPALTSMVRPPNKLLPTGHSCEANPEFIAEVRRILLLHLERNRRWSDWSLIRLDKLRVGSAS